MNFEQMMSPFIQQVGEESSRLEKGYCTHPWVPLGLPGPWRQREGRNGNGRAGRCRVVLGSGTRGVGCKPLTPSDIRFVAFTGVVSEMARTAEMKQGDPLKEGGACHLFRPWGVVQVVKQEWREMH